MANEEKMKRIFVYLILTGAVLLTGFSCLSSKKAQTDVSDVEGMARQTIVPDTFVLPTLPETLKDPDERARYLVTHYWDRFDFGNRELMGRPEITEQAFVDFVNLFGYVPMETTDASIASTLMKAEADTMVYRHFAQLFEKYLYEPNSPFRNDEYYLPVLRKVVKSPLLTMESLSQYKFQLEMVQKNRIGQVANDFEFATLTGKARRLFDTKSEYVLLMFTDPECPTCAAVSDQLRTSAPLNKVLSKNTNDRTMLAVLAIALDRVPAPWGVAYNGFPSGWVFGYDKSGEITNKKLYDVKAYPTLYLLDKEKKVVLKDTSPEAVESFFSVH